MQCTQVGRARQTTVLTERVRERRASVLNSRTGEDQGRCCQYHTHHCIGACWIAAGACIDLASSLAHSHSLCGCSVSVS